MKRIERMALTDDGIVIKLTDGQTVSAPFTLYPRLLIGTPDDRSKWRLIGKGEGIHWPDLDEDISVESILVGRPSNESQESLKRWLETPPVARKNNAQRSLRAFQ